jgi:hypothetical protein
MLFFAKPFLKFFFIAAFFLISSIASADEIKIFVANNILTLNSNNDNVEAVATQGSRIIDVGSREALISTYPNADLISNYKEATFSAWIY